MWRIGDCGDVGVHNARMPIALQDTAQTPGPNRAQEGRRPAGGRYRIEWDPHTTLYFIPYRMGPAHDCGAGMTSVWDP